VEEQIETDPSRLYHLSQLESALSQVENDAVQFTIKEPISNPQLEQRVERLQQEYEQTQKEIHDYFDSLKKWENQVFSLEYDLFEAQETPYREIIENIDLLSHKIQRALWFSEHPRHQSCIQAFTLMINQPESSVMKQQLIDQFGSIGGYYYTLYQLDLIPRSIFDRANIAGYTPYFPPQAKREEMLAEARQRFIRELGTISGIIPLFSPPLI
jgi:hypothetical protein